MAEPIFWLALSFLLVAVCLTALLLTAIPAFQELARAGRSVARLAETLSRELPPTLEAIRLTGLEISELSDELNQGAKSAGEAVKQVNDSIKGVKKGAVNVTVATKSAFAGFKAGWKSFSRPKRSPRRNAPTSEDANRIKQLPPAPQAPATPEITNARRPDPLEISEDIASDPKRSIDPPIAPPSAENGADRGNT
ncbi:DUF948 domain-containing protein [Tumidithrix elongata RA019]|uniref:DUF948 domain-containing protein n=1 Tax=Tumidithrix elongata BACA0141 TaxID=2716417 RepID=A0AAW9PPM6_9CYAN|nr:DUF948 domain-containing protein [Tumidithrix elongata RA019]